LPKTRLTQLAVDRLRSPDSGRVDYFDAHLPGFGLRGSAGGRPVWFLFYRVKGEQRRYTLGTVAAIPKVDRARDRARELLAEVARGVDPAVARDAPAPATSAIPSGRVNDFPFAAYICVTVALPAATGPLQYVAVTVASGVVKCCTVQPASARTALAVPAARPSAAAKINARRMVQ